MIHIVIASSEDAPWEAFSRTLSEFDDVKLSRAGSGRDVLDLVSAEPVSLVVCDEKLPDMTCLEAAHQLLMANPMVNCACVSEMDEDEFHEASEGLGLLAKVPPAPGPDDARRLLDRLKRVLGLASGDFSG